MGKVRLLDALVRLILHVSQTHQMHITHTYTGPTPVAHITYTVLVETLNHAHSPPDPYRHRTGPEAGRK